MTKIIPNFKIFYLKILFKAFIWEKCYGQDHKSTLTPDFLKKASVIEHQIMFVESASESLLQFCLSCVIIRQFGIINLEENLFERTVQIISLLTSALSMFVNFARVSSHWITTD